MGDSSQPQFGICVFANGASQRDPGTGRKRNPLFGHADPQGYQEFCRKLIEDLRPKGALEEQLARTMADTQWRLNRWRSIEQIILAAEPGHGYIAPHVIARFQRDQIESLNKFST